MPESKLVVSDTSPLLNLSLIDQLELLKDQFESITAPRQVWEEIADSYAALDREAVEQAIEYAVSRPDVIREQATSELTKQVVERQGRSREATA